jgi:hypothetical protein
MESGLPARASAPHPRPFPHKLRGGTENCRLCTGAVCVPAAEGPHPPAPCPRSAGEGENFALGRTRHARHERPAGIPRTPRHLPFPDLSAQADIA